MHTVKTLLCVSLFLNGSVAVAMAAPPKTVMLTVEYMTCELCPVTIKKALEKVPGVSNVTVEFDKKTATVTFDPDKANPEMMTKATTEAGYPSVMGKE